MFTYEVISSFTEIEQSIYKCIISNQDEICRMKIKDLAEKAHVSTATIIRFCKKLGCDGYSEFKLQYREHLKQQQIELIDNGETSIKSFFSQIGNSEFQQSLDRAFDIIKKSNQILFVGIGTSGILAKYGARFFSNVGRMSIAIDDPWMPILHQQIENTTTIALSESGCTQQTLLLAKHLQEYGSTLITITNNSNSPLAKMSECNICYHVTRIMTNRTNITTQLPVLYILEALAKRFYTAKEFDWSVVK